MHIIAFTTQTNYLDISSDSKLVRAIEKLAQKMNLTIIGVPLSQDHPFANHQVFDFWELNDYKKTGTIKWVVNSSERIDCFFYKKLLIQSDKTNR